ncbi:MAG TPA: recombinase family protein [Phototrophicaceae bacterium]|nr:recombinase family protein [Phototrophicaceae bacterium]
MGLRALIWAAVSTTQQANEDEKYSLPAQVDDALALCRREGWTVVEVLKVPGHSREYKTLDKLAADARIKGIDAFDRLICHLENCDFDVLICRDSNRFARKASLLHYIVESVIEDCGARIYSFNDGWVDATNADIFAMVKGYTTQKEMKWLRDGAKKGRDKLIEQGLPGTGHVLMSHRVVRDKRGKVCAVEVDENKRRLWEDVAYLLVQENMPWLRLSLVLFEQYGHASTTGRPIPHRTLWRIMYSPVFWGHTALGQRCRYGIWAFDESEPTPPGITVFRNQFEPMYTGDLAEQVKAELRRRHDILVGRARTGGAYMFTGLIICGHCGYRMVRRPAGYKHRTVLYMCDSKSPRYRYEKRFDCACTKRSINEKAIQRWFDTHLREMIVQADPQHFQPRSMSNPQYQIDAIKEEITQAERRIANLLIQRADTPPASQHILAQLIQEADARLQTLQRHLSDQQRRLKIEDISIAQARPAYEEILAYGVDVFWQLPENTINRLLAALLGNNRIQVTDGVVTSIALKVH